MQVLFLASDDPTLPSDSFNSVTVSDILVQQDQQPQEQEQLPVPLQLQRQLERSKPGQRVVRAQLHLMVRR
jgi:hypothetical protein